VDCYIFWSLRFEEYCKEKWDFSRIRAFRLIQSVEVRKNVLTGVNIEPKIIESVKSLPIGRLPENEAQALDGKTTKNNNY